MVNQYDELWEVVSVVIARRMRAGYRALYLRRDKIDTQYKAVINRPQFKTTSAL